MYHSLCLVLLALADASADDAIPPVQEIEKHVLDERSAIKSGVVSFKVTTKVNKQEPVAEKIGLAYTVYFKDGNFRMDEDRRLVDGTHLKGWSVYAFGRCLSSWRVEDPIIVSAKGTRTYDDLGIINPLLLGHSALPTVGLSALKSSNIVYLQLPPRFTRVAERDTIDGVDVLRISDTSMEHRFVHWVAPQFKWSVIGCVQFLDNKITTELRCPVRSYPQGDIYFPREITYRRFNERGELVHEEFTSVVEGKFNLDILDETFAMKALGIPAGRKVLDDNTLSTWDGKKLTEWVGSDPAGSDAMLQPKRSVSWLLIAASSFFALLAMLIALRFSKKLEH
jgi:hypothetical protein